MTYRALLFCPESKTALVVTQVLGELDFQVEPCHEPVAAIQKLTQAHWDAVVVDCADDENAALLFKQARDSGANPPALAVAVVDGKSGIAVAFRLGANLVLTKPISIEQSKSTLRVARRLLGGSGAKPVPTNAPVDTETNHSELAPADSAELISAVAPVPASSHDSATLSAAALSPAFGSHPETPVMELGESTLPAAAAARGIANLEDAAGSSGSRVPAAAKPAATKSVSESSSSGRTNAGSGAAAAPALAKEPDAVQAQESAVAVEQPAAAKRAPKPSTRKSGSNIQVVVLITLLIAAVAVGFWQWRNMRHPAVTVPVSNPVAPPQPTAVTPAASPAGTTLQLSASPTLPNQPSTTPAASATDVSQNLAATPAVPQAANNTSEAAPSADKTAPAQTSPAKAAPAPKAKAVGAASDPAKSAPAAKSH